MDRRQLLIALGLLCAFLGRANAFYVGATPPAGWAETAVSKVVHLSPADTAYANGIRSSIAASVNVGGRSVPMSVAYKYAANAGAAAARLSFGHPALWFALTAGTAAYQYFDENGYFVATGDNKWSKRLTSCTPSAPCTEWKGIWGGYSPPWFPSSSAAGNHLASFLGPNIAFVRVASTSCFEMKNTTTQATFCAQYQTQQAPPVTTIRPATEEEFVTDLSPKPIPQTLPNKWKYPLTEPIPVELPILNPSADPVPLARPLRVPQGEPQPVPDTNPQKYRQPVIDIVPSPTTAEPWRVDVQPKDLITESPTGQTEPAPVPTTPASGTSTTPKEDQLGLCDQYPDIAACQKITLGDLTPDTVTNKSVAMSITPQSGFGPSSGSCPADRTATVHGMQISMSWQPFCDFSNGIRPVVIGLAWLAAALGFIGFARKD